MSRLLFLLTVFVLIFTHQLIMGSCGIIIDHLKKKQEWSKGDPRNRRMVKVRTLANLANE